jgi:hypothetical protein
MSLPCRSDAAQALEVLALVQAELAEAVGRLADVAGRAVAVAARTEWRTDAAAVFQANVDVWRREVATLADELAAARERVGQDGARIEAQVWWCGT